MTKTPTEILNGLDLTCGGKTPKVIIWSLAYNHEKYIRQTLDSFIMQKTDFPFIAVIHDDCSTDGTSSIIREYAAKYPDIIKPFIEEENQYSKDTGTVISIMQNVVKASRVKYVAICECDDYWTDCHKLQKQVDFLDTHQNIVYTSHMYTILEDDTKELKTPPNLFVDRYPDVEGFEFDLDYALMGDLVTKTLTCMFRADALEKANLTQYPNSKDTHLVLELLSQGNGYCLNFFGGVYRRSSAGVWSSLDPKIQMETDLKYGIQIAQINPNPITMRLAQKRYLCYVFYCLRHGKLIKIFSMRRIFHTIFHPCEILKIRKSGEYALKHVLTLPLNKHIESENHSFNDK